MVVRIEVDSEIVLQVKQAYSETKRMTTTGVVDWALRLLVATRLASDIVLERKGVAVIMEKRRNLEE